LAVTVSVRTRAGGRRQMLWRVGDYEFHSMI
jgi:hypothetical protein